MRLRTIKLFLVAFAALVGIAFAQDSSITDPGTWFASASAWGGIVLTITAFLRANWLKGITGNRVLLLVFGTSIGGALVAASGALSRFGVSLEGTLVDALVFGVTAGGIAAGLWDASTRIAKAAGKANAVATVTALSLAPSGNSITDFILSLAKQAVSSVKVPAAVAAVAPLLAQFAQSELVLTDDLRSELQAKVLSALKKAGLAGVDL